MAIHFYLLKVADIQKETDEAVSVTFDIPVDLKDIFKFQHGQYVTVKVPINGEENRRAYSISSSPQEDKIRIGVKRVDGGKVSVFMNEKLKVGDHLEVMPPMGKFTIDLDKSNNKEYVFFGAGSGITPLISIIKSILATEENSKVHLMYSNKYENTIMYKTELEELSLKNPGRFKIAHVLSRDENWKGLKGRINEELCKSYVNETVSCDLPAAEYFLCGPREMMENVQSALKGLGVKSSNIHRESFTAALPKEAMNAETLKKDDSTNEEEIKTREITIILYGEEHKIEVEPDETVLTAAMTKGIDPPFSCQIGACSTCRARLKSGKVEMESRDALMDSEVEEGFILTCTSHPMSDDVVVDYDDNF